MVRRNNKNLYTQIMYDISKIIKKSLNENINYDDISNEDIIQNIKRIFKYWDGSINDNNINIDDVNKEIIIDNINNVYMNISTGLNRYNFKDYKILLPEETNIFISDSQSICRNIKDVKNSFLNVFSKNNKFGTIKLQYISVKDSDLGLDFLSDIYCDTLIFLTCRGFPTMSIDNNTFKNEYTEVYRDDKKLNNVVIKTVNKVKKEVKNPRSIKYKEIQKQLLIDNQNILIRQLGITSFDANYYEPGSRRRLMNIFRNFGFYDAKYGNPSTIPVKDEDYRKLFAQAEKTGVWIFSDSNVILSFVDKDTIYAIYGTETRWTLEDAFPGDSEFMIIKLNEN